MKNTVMDAETLLNTPLPPPRWLVPGLLPSGVTLLVGASKSGKSWLVLWLCTQLASGGTIWGRAVTPQTVLYLSLEDTLSRLQGRLNRLTSEKDLGRMLLQTEAKPLGQGLEQQLEAHLTNHPETALIVIDTLQKIRSADQSGSMYANDYRDISALKTLADKHGVAILLVHHLRKQSAADPFEQISGSNGLMGAADTVWLMQRSRGETSARLIVTGRDIEERTLTLRQQDCVWGLVNEESATEQEFNKVPSYLWKALDFLIRAGHWQGTASEWMKQAGIEGVPANQFSRMLAAHYNTVLRPHGFIYESKRTSQARVLTVWREPETPN